MSISHIKSPTDNEMDSDDEDYDDKLDQYLYLKQKPASLA